jgi:DNA-binding PadR family transcriptional regulator
MAKASASIPKTFIPVKFCYSHIGGQLGSLLSDHFIAKKWIEQVDGNERLYSITAKGKKAFAELGIDLSLITLQELV